MSYIIGTRHYVSINIDASGSIDEFLMKSYEVSEASTSHP